MPFIDLADFSNAGSDELGVHSEKRYLSPPMQTAEVMPLRAEPVPADAMNNMHAPPALPPTPTSLRQLPNVDLSWESGHFFVTWPRVAEVVLSSVYGNDAARKMATNEFFSLVDFGATPKTTCTLLRDTPNTRPLYAMFDELIEAYRRCVFTLKKRWCDLIRECILNCERTLRDTQFAIAAVEARARQRMTELDRACPIVTRVIEQEAMRVIDCIEQDAEVAMQRARATTMKPTSIADCTIDPAIKQRILTALVHVEEPAVLLEHYENVRHNIDCDVTRELDRECDAYWVAALQTSSHVSPPPGDGVLGRTS